MRIRFPFRRSAVCASLTALVLVAAAIPASAETLRIRYSLSLIGLPLGSAGLTGNFAPEGYSVEADAKLGGIAALVTSSRGAAMATGAFRDGAVLPNAYATTSASPQITRTVRMALDAGTVRAVEIVPPFDEVAGRVPVTDAHRQHVLDPISALIMPVAGPDQAIGPSACNRRLPIFDGYGRFDVTLSYVGTRDVKAKGYAGPVSVCSARYTPIAGHRPDRAATKFMTDNRQMEVWLAPVAGTRVVVPFRISVATMVGTTVIEAAEFTVDRGGRATVSR